MNNEERKINTPDEAIEVLKDSLARQIFLDEISKIDNGFACDYSKEDYIHLSWKALSNNWQCQKDSEEWKTFKRKARAIAWSMSLALIENLKWSKE